MAEAVRGFSDRHRIDWEWSTCQPMSIPSLIRPCPFCRKPVDWTKTPTIPFCSERCKTRDLGAWSEESYRVEGKPEEEVSEGWSEDTED